MASTNENTVIITDPKQLEKIKAAIVEASNSMTRIDSERDLIKDIKASAKQDLDITPKLFGQMLSAYHKQNYNEVTASFEEFEMLYEAAMN